MEKDSTPIRGPLLLVRSGELAAPIQGPQARVCMRLGAALKVARESKHLSLAELAVASGLAKSSLHDVERGAADLRISHLVQIARALDVSPSWLVKVAA